MGSLSKNITENALKRGLGIKVGVIRKKLSKWFLRWAAHDDLNRSQGAETNIS